ncbi:hypothetical protein LCGC14_3166300, partial [marine sediment metagenome]
RSLIETARVEFPWIGKHLCQIERYQHPKTKNRSADSLTHFDGVGEQTHDSPPYTPIRFTRIPSLRALSTIFSVIPDPGVAIKP